MIVALPLSMLVFGCVLGIVFGRTYRVRLLLLLVGISILVFAYCAWVPKRGQGYDDIGYAIVALLMAMPFGVGTLGGWLLGWRIAAAQARRRDAA